MTKVILGFGSLGGNLGNHLNPNFDGSQQDFPFVPIEYSATGNVYNDTLTESATATDSNAVMLTANPSITESATSSDSNTATATFNPSLTETGTAADTVSGGLLLTGSLSESASATDSNTVALTANATLTETGTSGDSNTVTATVNPALTESSAATDSNAASVTYTPSVTENATATDSNTVTATFIATLSESSTATDSNTDTVTGGGVVYNDSLSESVTASDSILDGLISASAGKPPFYGIGGDHGAYWPVVGIHRDAPESALEKTEAAQKPEKKKGKRTQEAVKSFEELASLLAQSDQRLKNVESLNKGLRKVAQKEAQRVAQERLEWQRKIEFERSYDDAAIAILLLTP